MKLFYNRLLSWAVIGSLLALSCTYPNKVQAWPAKYKKTSPEQMSPIVQAQQTTKKRHNPPIIIKSMDELDKYIGSGKATVLMIHAHGCGACRVSMEPFADAAEDNQNVTFLKVEGNKEVPQVLQKYPIRGYPTFIIFDANGKEVHKFSGGGLPKSALNKKIKDYIK